jgi:hypothetical protein
MSKTKSEAMEGMMKTALQTAAEERGRAARRAKQLPDLDGNPYKDDTSPDNLAGCWHHGWHMEDADIEDRKLARL